MTLTYSCPACFGPITTGGGHECHPADPVRVPCPVCGYEVKVLDGLLNGHGWHGFACSGSWEPVTQ